MKLNPLKCTFGVKGGKFLGFMVSERGIEVNPEKIQAIQSISPPKSIKEVQRLVGRIIALNRFISRLADRSVPFFKILRNAKKFEWTEECEKALKDLKAYLTSPPLLVKPIPREHLGLYLAISSDALSAVLVSLSRDHRPIYYISKILQGAERNYTEIERFALALVSSARRLRPYFQSHHVIVLTDQPLKQVLSKPGSSGRLAKWSVELSEFDITFKPRVAIKAQVLADFVLEKSEEGEETHKIDPLWIAHVDGSSVGNKGGIGVSLRAPDGIELDFAIKLDFDVTNNEAEYEAVIHAAQLALKNKVTSLSILTDSQLVAGQFEGIFETREDSMSKYLAKVKSMAMQFLSFSLQQIPRSENERADALSKFAYALDGADQRTVFMMNSNRSTLKELANPKMLTILEDVGGWREAITKFLDKGEVPSDPIQAKRIRVRSSRYFLEEGMLFKRTIDGPPLKCLDGSQTETVLREVHEGVCGNHVSGRLLAHKIKRAGYYWPTLLKDSVSLVEKCTPCQLNANVTRRPAANFRSMEGAWPFDQWGIDLVGPFPPASGQRKFIIVAVEYFTKWVEAEAVAKITDSSVWNFIWKNIICRFGIPRVLVSDNGSQFQNKKMEERCKGLGIKQHFASVGYPQANGQTEVTNRTIVNHLKTRLKGKKGNWADDLPAVLWAYRSTTRTATGETPFAMVYGTEAVLPVEQMEESIRVLNFSKEENEEQRSLDLDLVEEKRLTAMMKTQIYKANISKMYDKRVKQRTFQVGNWVLKKAEVSKHVGKLDPKWDGPFRIIKDCGNNAYKLADENGYELPRSWNAANLKKFFI